MMKRILALALVACSHGAPATAPVTTPAPVIAAGPEWDPLRGLLGSWQGTDPDSKNVGKFTLEPSLDGKILLRHNTDDGPHGHHEDVMIVFRTPAGLRASYFDNEGHVIAYAVTASANHVELISDEVPNMPRFKLVYDIKSADELAIEFLIAMPGQPEPKHFAGGTVHRVH
jgi:hypothetical protein